MEDGAYDASEHQLEFEVVAAQRSIAISLKRIADFLDTVKAEHKAQGGRA